MKSLKIITTALFLFISTNSFSQFGTLGLDVNQTIEMLKTENFSIVDSLKEIKYSPDGYDMEKGYVLSAIDDSYLILYYFTKYKICYKTEHVPLTTEAQEGSEITCKKYYKEIGKNKYTFLYNNISVDINVAKFTFEGKEYKKYITTYHH